MLLCMLQNITAILLLAQDQPITIKFPEKIQITAIGNSGNFNVYESKSRNILVITPKAKEFFVPMTVISESDRIYSFKLKSDPKPYDNRKVIINPPNDNIWKLKKRTKDYSVKANSCFYRIRKTSKTVLKINGSEFDSTTYLIPRGSALNINGEWL